MVQWGPAGYSMNIGKAGQRDDSAVVEAKREVFRTALNMGVHPCAEIEFPDEAREYLDMGVRHFNLGVDLSVLHSWWRSNGDELRKAIDGA